MSFIFVVNLEAMKFHARIGMLPHEAEFSQPVEIDVSAWVTRDEKAHGATGVLDYREVYDLVAGVVAEGHVLYLEDLVARIASGILELGAVQKVRVNARKPQVALAGPLAYAQVTLERVRNE